MTKIQMTETLQERFGTLDNSDFGHCLRLRLENITDYGFAAYALKTLRASDFTCYRLNAEIIFALSFASYFWDTILVRSQRSMVTGQMNCVCNSHDQ